ncbi:MAG TPA: metal-sulfur cluster assembly factor [Microbacteriaceae bacterium]|nr:metal-sulfur cluster assembly factor [Microbacteriaceae bacterium]
MTEPDAELIEKVEEALKDVIDPELGVDIVNLGLVYGYTWDAANQRLFIKATLTSAECGHQGIIGSQIAKAIEGIVPSHVVEWVWMPAWSPARVTEDGRDMMLALGFNV